MAIAWCPSFYGSFRTTKTTRFSKEPLKDLYKMEIPEGLTAVAAVCITLIVFYDADFKNILCFKNTADFFDTCSGIQNISVTIYFFLKIAKVWNWNFNLVKNERLKTFPV